MDDLLNLIPKDEQFRIRKVPFSEWTQPVSATLAQDLFADPDWIYEQLDGERCLAFRNGHDLTLMSRTRKDLNRKYPHLVEALRLQACQNFIVDGKVVALDTEMIRFGDHHDRRVRPARDDQAIEDARALYYIFDLLFADGYDISGLTPADRKNVLKRIFEFTDPLRFADCGQEIPHDYDDCDIKAPDAHGGSREKTSFKSARRQNFVIGGYTEPRGNRIGFGALLVGYYKDGQLCYAGKVGSGYDNDMLRSISRKLMRDERKTSPFAAEDVPAQDVHWVTPKYVGDVEFSEWTKDGRLRHPSFKGLNRDKAPSGITREGM